MIQDICGLQLILDKITMKNTCLNFKWQFQVFEGEFEGNSGYFLQVSFERPDSNTGIVGRGYGRKEWIDKTTTISGVVKTAWLLIELVVRHELMEGFRYDGYRIFNPHHTVEELIVAARMHEG